MKNIIKMLVVLTTIGLVSGGCLSLISNWAYPLIAANQKAETERAIFLVQPNGKSYETVADAGFEIYKVFDENKASVGYSLVYEGNGFQGKIRLMFGINKELTEVTSLEILDQVETPGLGTKVTEDFFRDQFKKLETTPTIGWVKGAPPEKPNEIQAITGATITSKAIVEIMNAGIDKARELKNRGAL